MIFKISDKDFLRIDNLEFNNSSYVQKKLNELAEKSIISGLFWKILISPIFFIHSFRQPKLKLFQVNKEIRRFRSNKKTNSFCVRTKIPFVFDCLARVVILDKKRITKQGQRYQILRNEINKAKKLGYTTEISQGESAEAMLDKFYQVAKKRNWRDESRYIIGKSKCNLFVCTGFNQDKEIIAINASLVSNSYAYMFYYCGIEQKNIRWLLSERAIEYAYNKGVHIFHTDNLLDVSTGSFIFQKALGYKTVRLKF